MATKAEDIWNDTLLSRLPGADAETVSYELRNTLRQFYRQSGSWIIDTPPIPLVAGKAVYDVSLKLPGVKVLFVNRVAYENRYLRLYDHETPRLASLTPGGPLAVVGVPATPGSLKFIPTPQGSDLKSFVATVALTADDLRCNVPDYVQSHFFDTIVDGVLSRMFMHIKRPYSAPAHAEQHARRFRNGVAEARDMARRNFTLAETSTHFPPWAV